MDESILVVVIKQSQTKFIIDLQLYVKKKKKLFKLLRLNLYENGFQYFCLKLGNVVKYNLKLHY